MISDLVLTDVRYNVQSVITNAVEKMEMSWTMDSVSQMRLTLIDPDMKFLANDYFAARRTMTYGGAEFEVASIELSEGIGNVARMTVEARRSSIQKIKRDKNPTAYSGVTATDYARIIAARYEMNFVGEPTSEKGTITQANTDTAKESVWDVLTRIAGEAKFVVFEADNVLFFCSQEWLINKREVITASWPSTGDQTYKILTRPTCRTSEDDIYAAEIGLTMERTNATDLRPGMTLDLKGIPQFEQRYIITEVSYDEGSIDPVTVSARTPEKTADL